MEINFIHFFFIIIMFIIYYLSKPCKNSNNYIEVHTIDKKSDDERHKKLMKNKQNRLDKILECKKNT